MITAEDLKATGERNLGLVRGKRKELAAQMRRCTCLKDEEIMRILNEIADVAYSAGWEVGCTETMMKAQEALARAKLSRWVAAIVTAACVVYLISL